MRLHPWHSVPAALFARALALALLPREDIDAITAPRYRDGERRPAAHPYEIALLHTPLLAGAARVVAQQRVLDEARALAARNPVWGVEAYARLLPAVDAQTAATLRADAARLLDRITPSAALRDAVRVLAPDRLAAWLAAACADLLNDAWHTSQAVFRERVSRLHLLNGEALARAGAGALAGIPQLTHEHITAEAETGLGGARRFNDADVRAAERDAHREALLTLAPWLPQLLHASAQTLAHDLGVTLADELGSALTHTHPNARHWPDWFRREAVPAYTLAEKHAALGQMDETGRAALIVSAVRDAQQLLDGKRLDGRYGRAPDALESILTTVAPFLDKTQTGALLARYGLPMSEDALTPPGSR